MAGQKFVSSRHSMRAGYANGGSFGRNQNLVDYTNRTKLGPIANIITIILLVALLCMMYVAQVSRTGSYGYELNSINERKTQLAAERDDLKVENARLQSLAVIKNSDVAKKMSQPASTDYAE